MADRINNHGPIGYYVHHHGLGHLQRALVICRQISQPVVMFSNQPAPSNLPPHVTFIQLVSDMVDGHQQPTDSALHYTPYSAAIFSRYQQLIDAWRELAITAIYVDVSIEVALLAKLYGLNVGHALMLGDRTDTAHSFGYAAVDYLIAHFPVTFDEPQHHVTQTPIHYVGGIARFPKQPISPLINSQMPAIITVTCSPKAETIMVDSVLQTAKQFPDTTWHIVGQQLTTKLSNVIGHGIVDNPLNIYQLSDVIVGSAGTNTIMEVASLGKPFVCIPEQRPFAEQLSAAQSLQRLGAAVYLPAFPLSNEWPGLCQQLATLNLTAFSDLVSQQAASQAAKIIQAAGQTL